MTGHDSLIAVVGAACRFPDAADVAQFWRNIADGAVAVRELDKEDLRAAGVAEADIEDPSYVRTAAVLHGAAEFAGDFFGYSPTEAEYIDPPQRIFLETCWEALEAAGHPARPDGPVTGVFAGSSPSTYMTALHAARAAGGGVMAAVDDVELHLGGLGDFLTSRVAYKLGLRGPSVTVQTACSSSLTAVHYAVLSLLSGECDIALAGGACVNEPVTGYRYQPGGLASADGLCRAFDVQSTGTSFSSGVGVVALRRLDDALADGDEILAVVSGSAVGNDGADRSGFTAPNPNAVSEVVSAALALSGIAVEDLRYAEAHGSGTALGDQIELRALSQAVRGSSQDAGFCGLGSVKVNIGHCGPAAGIAGFIKAIHIARTGQLPPHPLFRSARNPGVLAESPFRISAEQSTVKPGPVLVNSMGLGGTNAAVIVEPPPARPPREPASDTRVRLLLSARTRVELDAMSRNLAEVVDSGTVDLRDIAHTLKVGRAAFDHRRAVVAEPDRIAAALRLPRPPLATTVKCERRLRPVLVTEAPAAVPQVVLDHLALAFGGPLEVHTGPTEALGADRFAILLGREATGRNQTVLPSEARPEDLEPVLTAAWLGGVSVDWGKAATGTGRRVPLPTYPFTRRRYWALDRLPPIAAPAQRAPAPAPSGAPTGDLEQDLCGLWRELFGIAEVGVDDEFGALGGSSLLSVRMALEIQQLTGVLVNVHRAGGSRATPRRIAAIVRSLRDGAEAGDADAGAVADGDGELVDQDIQIALREFDPVQTEGTDVLLTGATGFLGAFVLHELLQTSGADVYCLVRAATDEQARERLRAKAAELRLPEPDFGRVRVVLGDLEEVGTRCREYRNGELNRRIGHVIHCAAKVVFTEPYRVLRKDNVQPLVDLLDWMAEFGIRDVSLVSTVAATGYAMGTDHRILETRDQPLDPLQGGYGVSKWVCERILERAETLGARVRVFRPGFILGSVETGACNTKDLLWHLAASGLAVGMHPFDDRAMPMASVDLVSRGIAQLALRPGSAGVAYHLVHEEAVSPRRLFELLSSVGWDTVGTTHDDWQKAIAKRALAEDNEILSTMALYELEGHELGERGLEAVAWRGWLEEGGLSSAPTGQLVQRSLRYVAEHDPRFADLLRAYQTDGGPSSAEEAKQ